MTTIASLSSFEASGRVGLSLSLLSGSTPAFLFRSSFLFRFRLIDVLSIGALKNVSLRPESASFVLQNRVP